MDQRYLLGNEAIALACLESPVGFVSGYPGTPSSEVIEIIVAHPDRSSYVEWSVNEKVAFENALAAAWCGVRSLVTMKHVPGLEHTCFCDCPALFFEVWLFQL